jgi:hypothetical protein
VASGEGTYTENGAYKLTDNAFNCLKQEMDVWGIFCDVAKISVCVYHAVLLAKLQFYDI